MQGSYLKLRSQERLLQEGEPAAGLQQVCEGQSKRERERGKQGQQWGTQQ